MQSVMDSWLNGMMLASAIVVAVAMINRSRARLQKRAEDLRSAKLAFLAHSEAVRTLVSDPAVSSETKVFLEWLLDRMTEEEFARRLIEVLDGEARRAAGGGQHDIIRELGALSRTRPDLVDHFHVAMQSALAYIYLRWPGNSEKFQRLTVELAVDARKERAITQWLAQLMRRARDGDAYPGMAAA